MQHGLEANHNMGYKKHHRSIGGGFNIIVVNAVPRGGEDEKRCVEYFKF